MKLLPLIIAFCFLTVNGSAQDSNCSITDTYKDVFYLESRSNDKRSFFVRSQLPISETHCLAKLFNDRDYYFNYLMGNFGDYTFQVRIETIEDSLERHLEFSEGLKADTAFTRLMNPLQAKINNPTLFVPDTVTMDKLLNYAVKFFLIPSITPEGHYSVQICGGLNGIHLTKEKRNPHVEAFCFDAIFKNYVNEETPRLFDELITGIKEVYTLQLGENEQDRLLRAQGALFMVMRHNEVLQAVLVAAYEQQKNLLPFVLVQKS